MMERQKSPAADTLLRMSQAAQMASYLSQVSDRLADSAVAWAKEMHWLQHPRLECPTQYGDCLNDRTRAVDAALAEMLAGRRVVQAHLQRMQDLAAMRRETAGDLLDRLQIGASRIAVKSATPNAVSPAKAKCLRLPVDLAMDEVAAAVLDACTELQSRNARLEAAMRRLPELHCA